jgi:hypothetical protein
MTFSAVSVLWPGQLEPSFKTPAGTGLPECGIQAGMARGSLNHACGKARMRRQSHRNRQL